MDTFLKYIIPTLSSLFSVIAFYYSHKAIKKTDRISKPRIYNKQISGGDYIIYLSDSTANKNLDIRGIYYKKYDTYKYIKVKHEEEKAKSEFFPLIKIYLKGFAFGHSGTIKIDTNYGDVYVYISDTFDIETIRWYQLNKIVRSYFHKKKYDANW